MKSANDGQDVPAAGSHRSFLRGAGYLLLSLALHGMVVLLLSLAVVRGELRPKLDVVWLDLDNKLAAAPLATTSEAPAKRASSSPAQGRPISPERDTGSGHQSADQAERRRPFRTDQVRLSALAPGQAALILLLRCDRIRRSPYAGAVRELLEVFYDYKALLRHSAIDPLRDFDALLIATPNPYRITQTFLAARHHLGTEALMRAIDRSAGLGAAGLEWRREAEQWIGQVPSPPRLRHDRRVVVLRDRLLVLGDKGLVRVLGQPGSSAPRRDAVVGRPGRKNPTTFDLLGSLDEQGGRGRRGPGLLVQAINLSRLVQLPPDLPVPRNVKLTVPATDPALLHGILSFATAADARTVARRLVQTFSALERSLLLIALGYDRLVGRIVVRPRGRRVELRLRLVARELIPLLGMLRDMIPQVNVPGEKPRMVPTAVPTTRSTLEPALGRLRPRSAKEGRP